MHKCLQCNSVKGPDAELSAAKTGSERPTLPYTKRLETQVGDERHTTTLMQDCLAGRITTGQRRVERVSQRRGNIQIAKTCNYRQGRWSRSKPSGSRSKKAEELHPMALSRLDRSNLESLSTAGIVHCCPACCDKLLIFLYRQKKVFKRDCPNRVRCLQSLF